MKNQVNIISCVKLFIVFKHKMRTKISNIHKILMIIIFDLIILIDLYLMTRIKSFNLQTNFNFYYFYAHHSTSSTQKQKIIRTVQQYDDV
jgi:hypothetical protein